jgi:hypothetical protein
MSVLGLTFLLPVFAPVADAQVYYLAAVLVLLTILPLVLALIGGTLDIFEPIIPISVLIGLAFGVRAMYLAYEPANAILPVFLSRVPFEDFIPSALVMAIASYCALLLGYYVIASRFPLTPLHLRPFARRRAWPSRAHGGKIATLIAIAAWATFARINAGDVVGAGGPASVTASTFTLMVLSSFAQCAACILSLYIARGDDRRWLPLVLWLITLPLTVIQSLAFAGKTPILLAVYVIMAAHHYANRRLRLGVVSAGIVVSVLLVFPTVNLFRISDDDVPLSAAAPTVEQFASHIGSIPALFARMAPSEYFQLAAEGVLVRSNGVDALAMLMKYDVSDELADPSLYLKIPLIAFVPRVLWPDKPVIQAGATFGRLFFVPLEYQSSLDTISIGMYHIGDLYVTFGVAGVLIGMCLLGCIYRLFYRLFDPIRSSDLSMKFLYIVMLFPLVNGFESDIPTTYGNLLKSVLAWALIKAWLDTPVPGRVVSGTPIHGSLPRQHALHTAHGRSTAR